MQVFTEELQDGITRVVLDGRMDSEGANAIDLKMNIIGGTKTAVLVDMQKVSYLASIGIGVLVTVAKAMQKRGGKIRVLRTLCARRSGPPEHPYIYRVIPVHYELEPAIAALK